MAEFVQSISILVLEDDDADAALITRELGRMDWAQANVTRVKSLSEARGVLVSKPFDLIVADMELPDSSGLATINGLVTDRTAPPIIAHTGHVELARRAVVVGADDYVIKGLGQERLTHVVRYAIARARSRADLRSVIDGNMDAMVVVDASNHIVLFANAACKTVFGREPSELVGEVFGFQSTSQSVVQLEIRRNGETCTAEMRTTPVDWHGRDALLNCVRDTTDRTRAHEYEQRLVHANRLAAIGQLAAGVAHEVNNPAAFILVNLQQVQEQLKSIRGALGDTLPSVRDQLDECSEMVNDSLVGTRRVASIVKGLRSFARIESNDLEVVDFNDLVRLACRMATNEIRHRASLVTDLGALPPIAAHRAQLSQVVLNLLINAAQAIEGSESSDHEIRLTTVFDGDEIILTIEDSGSGIAEHVLPNVFDPFFTTKERDAGTGLGLAICAETVRKHRGTIDVESTLGEGTRFTVRLPTQNELHPSGRPPSVRVAMPDSRDRAKVLLVDDDPMVRRAFLRIIGSKHDATEAQGGEEALRCLATDTYDIILCDLMMPGIDGPALYDAAMAMNPSLAELFVFVSGGAFSASTRSFLERVQPLVLEKPVSRDVLLGIVARSKGASASN